jgi:hypothetical protein
MEINQHLRMKTMTGCMTNITDLDTNSDIVTLEAME